MRSVVLFELRDVVRSDCGGSAALVNELTNSLNEESSPDEARLKSALREKLPIITSEMVADVAINSDVSTPCPPPRPAFASLTCAPPPPLPPPEEQSM